MKFEWINEGKEFRPRIEFDDLDGYEAKQDSWFEAVKKGEKQKATALLRSQAEFVETVLRRSLPGVNGELSLDAVQVRDAFKALWDLVFPAPKTDKDQVESPLD